MESYYIPTHVSGRQRYIYNMYNNDMVHIYRQHYYFFFNLRHKNIVFNDKSVYILYTCDRLDFEWPFIVWVCVSTLYIMKHKN